MNQAPHLPPAWGEAILRRIFRGIEGESLAGDYAVLYREIRRDRGPAAALAWYALQVLKSVLTAAAVGIDWSIAMFKNYFKVAYRNLIKHKAYSMINISGLALGIACCILIFSYVGYELSFDHYHDNADSIHRLISKLTVEGQTQEYSSAAGPVAPALIQDFPEVMDAVRISGTVIRSFLYKDKSFFEDGVFYVDHSIFRVFSIEWVKGDPKTALEAPYTMVLTEATAHKYFGDEDPIGEVINWDTSADYTVTGIVKAPPANSHFRFNVLASLATYFKYDPRLGNRWTLYGYTTYLQLTEDADPKAFERKLPGFIDQYLSGAVEASEAELEMYLQPLEGIHLNSRLGNALGVTNDIRLIRIFAAIAVIILCIACINFMNLATARSSGRAKEVGMRKVLGAERKRLIVQFLGESFFFAGLSLILAAVLARLALPWFNRLAERDLSLHGASMPGLALLLLGIALFVGFFAGSYPAFFLSAFRPVQALRGTRGGGRRSWFRSILVVLQFAISIILVVCTLIIFNQQQYMENKDLGFNKEQKLVIALQNEAVRKGLGSFKTTLRKIPGVVDACGGSMVPGERYIRSTVTTPEGFGENQTIRMDHYFVDDDYVGVFGIEIVKGRGFSKEIPTDVNDAVMINLEAAERLGWEDPLGKIISVPRHPYGSDKDIVPRTVIGVFRNIHQRSLYAPIFPTIVEHVRDVGAIEYRSRRLAVQLDTDDIPGVMAEVEAAWKTMFPGHPYYAFFLDEFYDGLHQAERKLSQIFSAFAIMAVIIGCLGLLGLASFTAEQRTKEIGIRKVFGSSVGGIVVRLSRDFIRLIVIANLIAWPIAFLAMRNWLRGFPYPVEIGIASFIGSALLTLLVGLFMVGFQAVRAARADPIVSLRYE